MGFPGFFLASSLLFMRILCPPGIHVWPITFKVTGTELSTSQEEAGHHCALTSGRSCMNKLLKLCIALSLAVGTVGLFAEDPLSAAAEKHQSAHNSSPG